MLKILYLSRNMDMYHGAMYQKEVIAELSRQARVDLYGPGFSGYDINDTIHSILKKVKNKPDIIVMGHAWLMDRADHPVDPHPKLFLEQTTIPKIGILNKEYVCLSEKLDYIKSKHFDMVFTHHHDIGRYKKYTGIEFVFWPFAFDPKKFGQQNNNNRTIDLAFSGVLQNLNKDAGQTDIRVNIQKRIFKCIGDIPVFKRKAFQKVSVFWNAIPRNKMQQYMATLFGKHRYLSEAEYSRLHCETKVYLNTLSPMGLVSPRYYENMASRTLVFCEESNIYNRLFPDNCYVAFKSNLSDFEEKLLYYIEHDEKRKKITDAAYSEVMEKHTWPKRLEYFLEKVTNNTAVVI